MDQFFVKKAVFCFFCLYVIVLVGVYKYSIITYAGKVKDTWVRSFHESAKENGTSTVEIWGKASIADYLWLHILKGPIKSENHGFLRYGALVQEDIEFIFRSGPGYIQTTVPQDVQNLVIVLNGRTEEKVQSAIDWLDYLPKLSNLRRTGVVLLGNEECKNDWILRYMRSQGGYIDVLFVVYDCPLVDDKEIFQWPLGVAVYRGFPNIDLSHSVLTSYRPYKCNFVGTIYENSSREEVYRFLSSRAHQYQCILLHRNKWLQKETNESLNKYVSVVTNSDLTLSPVGKNTECYRIYEALSVGSIPVVENVMTPGKCLYPLRLLKKYKAPIIYVDDWKNIDYTLRADQNLTIKKIIKRRIIAYLWYKQFKHDLADFFVRVIRNKFF